MKIGILGGTFDPIHNGHIKVAEEVRSQLGLAIVIFVPAGQPWLKAGNAISAAEHRLEMLRLALADYPYFILALTEINRSGPSYTVDTIAEMRAELKAEDELFFILGWDSLSQVPRWKEPTRLIKLCRLVAVPRPGYSLPDIKKLKEKIPGLSESLILLEKPEIDISATEIRRKVAEGFSIHGLVPPSVEKYIEQHRLYVCCD